MSDSESEFKRGPNALHPEEPSAVGSRNSLNRDGRDEYFEARKVVDEEVDKIINHINAKLPPEVLQDLKVMGNVKSHLHNYFNQGMQNMLNRYLTTAEDELGKKMRDMIDKEEQKTLNRYSPKEIAELLEDVGGPDLFNTNEVDSSMVNIMGHLQGHVQRGTYDFEVATTDILLQHKDVGGFLRGKNTVSVAKCTFRDHYTKPDTVVDVKLAVNVLNEELVSPIVPHQLVAEHLIKEVISDQIQSLVGKEIDEINGQLSGEGRPELSPPEAFFEKIKAIENYTDDDLGDNSRRYQLLPKQFLDRIEGLAGEMDNMDFDPLGVREGVSSLLADEGLRTRGWNTAINSLTTILDNFRMGYQYSQNFKNSRHLEVREYEQTDTSQLPDERFEISMRFFDAKQLREEKVAYAAQVAEFKREVLRLWSVVDAVYLEEKSRSGKRDWDDLVEATLQRDAPKRKGWFQSAPVESAENSKKIWDEVTFVKRELTTLEKDNQTYEKEITEFKYRLKILRKKLVDIYGVHFPETRMLIEQRLNFLESQFLVFMSRVNPFNIHPGLLLEMDLCSIKRKLVTVKGMTNVLNEFLNQVSKGFEDASMSHFQHRRSHVPDPAEEFGSPA